MNDRSLKRSALACALAVIGGIAALPHYGRNTDDMESHDPRQDHTEKTATTYALDWFTIDGGGTSFPDGAESYRLVGTLGQPDAGLVAEGTYGLRGGFWAEPSAVLFRDGFESGNVSAWSQVTGGR